MRLCAFLLEQRAEPRSGLEFFLRHLLAAQVGFLECDEVERELVTMLAQEAPGEQLVDSVEREGVPAHDACDVRAQPAWVPKPLQRATRQLCAPLCVSAVRAGLAGVVKERRQA